MPFIMNNAEIAKSITERIESAASGFSLKSVSLKATDNVEVDTECSLTYDAGVKIVEMFKEHLNNASVFVSEVSTKLEEADKKAATANQSAFSIPFLQGSVPDAFSSINQFLDYSIDK